MNNERRCYKCGQPGHIVRFCKDNNDSQNHKETRNCYKCNRPGHIARDCTEAISKPIQCHRCQSFGHIARNCTTDLQCSDRRNDEEDLALGCKSQSFYSRRRSPSTPDSSESDSTTPPVTRREILKSSQPKSHFSKPSSKIWSPPTPPITKKGILKSLLIENSSTQITDSQDTSHTSTFRPIQVIRICEGDLTEQKVDVIVVCSSSDTLRESVLEVCGPSLRMTYEKTKKAGNECFAVGCSGFQFKKILFLPWTPNSKPVFLEQTIRSFIVTASEYALNNKYTSMAFPAIGCGRFGMDVAYVAQTMVNFIKFEKYPLHVTFVIHPSTQDILRAFQAAHRSPSAIQILPDLWSYTNNNRDLRVLVQINTTEFNTIVQEFNKTMSGQYKKINRIEYIQNERWHKQYIVHRDDFKKSLKMNTEKFLYHGCSDAAATSIIRDYFNRSFAGKHGTVYGNGVYFSSNAQYSHSYTVPNQQNERCMFYARVLIGHTTLGDSTMKVCPEKYHSTTDGEHIYVTYYDTQAYGQYLIYYQ